jgi:hypothetical protein
LEIQLILGWLIQVDPAPAQRPWAQPWPQPWGLLEELMPLLLVNL